MDIRILPETDREILMFEEIKRLMEESNIRYKRIAELERINDQLRGNQGRQIVLEKRLDDANSILLKQAILVSDLWDKIKELEEYDR